MVRTKLFLLMTLSVFLLALSGCGVIDINPGDQEGRLEEKELSATKRPADPRDQAIEDAFKRHIAGREDIVAFLIYDVKFDHVDYSDDGKIGLAWLILSEPDTGDVIPGESGLALAFLSGPDGNQAESWKIVVQADAEWNEFINQVPDALLSAELRGRYTSNTQPAQHAGKALSGYKLPWQPGLAKRVSGSIGHVLTYKSCPATCMYAFDFADGTMFPVLAARSGRVKYAVWQYPNGNTEHANFMVLEDTSTTPTTYQVYYHLAQNSIPNEFRTPGAQVFQGQFIGNADDTGPSTGHHLHFHVHANPNTYWGTSVDVTFDDVTINGGRPRTCTEANNFPDYGSQCQSGNLFVSGNGDNKAPTGGLDAPLVNQIITEPVVHIAGWAKDESGLKSIQVMANYDGNWKPVGPEVKTSPFAFDVDLCQIGVPDGPILFGMRIQDQAGKYSEGVPGQRLVEKKYDCAPPPPVCEPTDDQIAIYSDPGLVGTCQVLDVGDYGNAGSFGVVKDNDIESVEIGRDVLVQLFDQPGFAGDPETLLESDEMLADNFIQANTVSSLRVMQKPPVPGAPKLSAPRNPYDLPPTNQDDITLSWQAGEFADMHRSELSGADGIFLSIDWQSSSSWQIGKLPVGDYTWTVWGRNLSGESSANLNFSVVKADLASESRLLPIEEIPATSVFTLKWEVTSGEDDLDHFEIQYRDNSDGWQSWNRPLPSQVRQALFLGDPGHSYEFRIRSIDQKGNQEAFPDEPEASITIETDCIPDSYEKVNPGDNRWTDATPLEVGDAAQEHNFCGLGDEDWISFPAEAGTSMRFSTQPLNGMAAAAIQLVAPDGYNLLAVQKPGDLNQPARLEWTAPEDGVYFLRLTPLDPRLVGSDVRYNVKIEKTGMVSTPTIFLSTLVLPVIWFIVRLYYRLRTRVDPED